MPPAKPVLIAKKRSADAVAISLAMLVFAAHTLAQVPAPALSWHFDESDGDQAAEQIRHADGEISGVYLHVAAVHGNGLRLDGETSGIAVKASMLLDLAPAFTVEAWIAIDAYPWNWAPI